MKFALLFLPAIAFAQPAFEAASIRTIDAGLHHEKTIIDEPGRLTMRSVTLRDCIDWAWEIQPPQLSGPPWIADTPFDIAAKAAGPADTPQLRLMLRELLTERFGLKLHHEQKVLPVYSMTVAPNGPRFHDPGPKDPSKFLQSASRGLLHLGGDRTGLSAENMTMPDLAIELTQPLQRPVVDKTGLKGKYDIRIDVAEFMTTAGNADSAGPIDEMSVIFQARPAQLGLKLEPGKEPVDLLIIDSANRQPTEN